MDVSKIEIAICDDEPIMLEIADGKCKRIMNLLNIKSFNISLFNNPNNLVKSNQIYHIYILDVEMPKVNGFNLASAIKRTNDDAIFIYITSHDELIKEAFKINAFRYLYKPIDDKELYEALKNAINKIKDIDNIILRKDEKNILIPLKKIYHIESLGDGCSIVLKDAFFIDRRPLKDWIERLSNKAFVQTHRAYLVNMHYVKEVGINQITMHNNKVISMSVRKQKFVIDALHKYAKSSIYR